MKILVYWFKIVTLPAKHSPKNQADMMNLPKVIGLWNKQGMFCSTWRLRGFKIVSLWDVKIAHTNKPLWWVDRLHRSKWCSEYRSIENSAALLWLVKVVKTNFLWGEWIDESHNNKASAGAPRYLNVCISKWIILYGMWPLS